MRLKAQRKKERQTGKHKKWMSFVNFAYAFEGVLFLIKTERNPIIYLLLMVVLSIMGVHYHLTSHEWIALIITWSLVWMAEALNTAIELLADEISQEQRERLGRAKDVAAGGVLLAALGVMAVALLVFWPHL